MHFVPVHLHRWYRDELGTRRGDFPISEAIGDSTLSLPLSAAMTLDDTRDVIAAVRKIAMHYRASAPVVAGWSAGELREAA